MSTRRTFLKGLGTAAAALPFLRSFPASGQSSGAQPKLIIFVSPNGFLVGPNGGQGQGYSYQGWRPAGFPSQGVQVGTSMALPAVLPEIFRPLERHRSRVLFLEGLRQIEAQDPKCPEPHDPHWAAPALLTGANPLYEKQNAGCTNAYPDIFGARASIDQLLGQRLGVDPLVLSAPVQSEHLNESFLSFRGPRQRVTPIQRAIDAFDRVFTGTGNDVNARRAAVLRTLDEGFADVLRKVPSADRPRLEAHRDAVSQLGTSLARAACGASALTRPADYPVGYGTNVPRLMRDYIDVTVEAMRCGWTRIALLQAGNTGGNFEVNWSEYGTPGGGAWDHELAHELGGDTPVSQGAPRFSRADAVRFGVKLQSAYNEMFARLLDRLLAAEDVDGKPLLDNTLVLHVKPAGENHEWTRLLWVLAGGQGLGVRAGQFRVVGLRSAPYTYYNDLWLSVCHLMGATDLTAFGEQRFNRAPLSLS